MSQSAMMSVAWWIPRSAPSSTGRVKEHCNTVDEPVCSSVLETECSTVSDRQCSTGMTSIFIPTI